jgi:hypothetical protein
MTAHPITEEPPMVVSIAYHSYLVERARRAAAPSDRFAERRTVRSPAPVPARPGMPVVW